MSISDDIQTIAEELKRTGFKTSKPGNGWRIFSIGDNYFDLTKKFARFEIRLLQNGKIMISAMVAVATNERDRISKITWAESKKVSKDDFFKKASKLLRDLKQNMTQKSESKNAKRKL